MSWDMLDFAVMAALLIGVVATYKLVIRRAPNSTYRWGVRAALLTVFLLIWVNGAVGIIGGENNDANMLYVAVPIIGLIFAVAARFKAPGMQRALYAMAATQVLVTAVGVFIGDRVAASGVPTDAIVITVFFVAAWLACAQIFARSVRGLF